MKLDLAATRVAWAFVIVAYAYFGLHLMGYLT